MEEHLKGFYTHEVVDLYHYLCIYENELKYIKNQECLWKQHPKLKKLEELISNFECNYCTKESLQNCALAPINNLVSMTKCKTSKVLSFLHHLRNSIAHGQIEQEEDYVHLIDYDYEKDSKLGKMHKNYSARGKIKSSVLFEIMCIINKNIDL